MESAHIALPNKLNFEKAVEEDGHVGGSEGDVFNTVHDNFEYPRKRYEHNVGDEGDVIHRVNGNLKMLWMMVRMFVFVKVM